MTDVKVTFVGSLLFRKRGDNAFEAIVPYADVANARYDDDTKANQHWPLLVILDPSTNSIVERRRLHGLTLSIGVGNPPVNTQELDGLIDLKQIANAKIKQPPAEMIRNNTAAAVIEVHGGSLSSVGCGIAAMRFNKHLVPGHDYKPKTVVWRLDLHLPVPTTIKGFPAGDLVIDAPSEIYVGNFDTPDPTWSDLQAEEGEAWQSTRDDDFKWVYKVTEPNTGGDWRTRLGGPHRELPLPEGTFGGGQWPSVGRCLGALLK